MLLPRLRINLRCLFWAALFNDFVIISPIIRLPDKILPGANKEEHEPQISWHKWAEMAATDLSSVGGTATSSFVLKPWNPRILCSIGVQLGVICSSFPVLCVHVKCRCKFHDRCCKKSQRTQIQTWKGSHKAMTSNLYLDIFSQHMFPSSC